MTSSRSVPLRPGDYAPGFALPAVNRDGVVALEDYRGRCPVLVGLLRGLHCPFCRRQVITLQATQEKVAREGVEVLAIVNTRLERARSYFQYRPTRVLLAADPDRQTHQAFGLPKIKVLPDETSFDELQWPVTTTRAYLATLRFNPTGELPEPMNGFAAEEILNKADRFQYTDIDREMIVAHAPQLTGHFLIDSTGVIRWAFIGGIDEPNEWSTFPTDGALLAAAQALSR